MAKRRAVVTIGTLGLERASSVPLYRQLYDGLREAILSGRLRPGVRLPSTRVLAEDLRSSRNTVLAAFGQLLAEGYLESRVGAGTTVARTLPETLLRARPEASGAGRPGRRPRLSRRGTLLLGTRVSFAGGRSRPTRSGPASRGSTRSRSICGHGWSRGGGGTSRDSSSITGIRPATRRSARRSRRISPRPGRCAARRRR